MVKIRKKTSNRTTTRMRAKVKHKVAESKKKLKKHAKKDVTWKSNKPKDIGIPNSFPFKDQILAEAQAEKARDEAEKLERREAARNGTSATLASTAALAAALAADSQAMEDMVLDEDADEGEKQVQDASLKLHAKSLKKVLEMSDVVIEVLDARDPVGTRCRAVEKEMKTLDGGRKKLVLVLNKIDLVPPHVVQAWLDHLRLQAPTIAFKSSTQQQRNHLSASSVATPQSASGSSTKPLMELIKGFRLNASSAPGSGVNGGGDSTGKAVRTSLTIGLVGHPNVGKSSLINTLKRSKACSVAPTPGWTKEVQEVVLEKGIRVLDCPGVVVEQRGQVEGALKGMVKPEEVLDCKAPVEAILARCKREHLQMLYNIPYFDSLTSFLLEVARAKGRLRKGGVPDLDGTARSILRDWVAGRIPYYTAPPTKEETALLKQQVSKEAKVVGTVSSADVGGAQIITGGFSAPNIDLAALFGEADAAAFEGEGSAGSSMAGKKAVKMAEGALGVESEDANVGWAMEDDEEEVEEEQTMEDDLGLDDLLDDDDEMEEDDSPEPAPAPVPAPTKSKSKKRPSATGPGVNIVSVAPPTKKGKLSKSVSFSSAPLGPTGSAAAPAASAPSAATSNKQQFAAEAADMGLNKKSKADAKKAKKKAGKKAAKVNEEVKEVVREFGEDADLPSKPQPAKRVGGAAGTSQAYDMTEFFGPNA